VQSPSYAYLAPGTFTATLTVTDSCGVANADSFDVVVCAVAFVTATANGPSVTVLGTAVSFTGSASGGAPPYSYAWDFDDGATSAEQNPTYTYPLAGTYDVELTATDACGNVSAPDTFTITVCASALVITADTSDGVKIAVQDEDRLFNSTVLTGTPPFTYLWNFGDGSPTTAAVDPIHKYLVSGIYTVTLTVDDSCGSGRTEVDSFDITVCTAALLITADTIPAAIYAKPPVPPIADRGIPKGFRGEVFPLGVAPYTFQWDFGDGGTITVVGGAVEDVIYTYDCFGPFYVTLTVIDACGVTTWVNFWIDVSDGAEVFLTASATVPATTTVDEPATFIGSSVGGNVPPVPSIVYEWDFGDGGKATGQIVDHTYTVSDTWTVTLTATDECGVQDILSFTVDSECPALAVAATGPATATVDTPVSFTGSSGGIQPLSYAWDFDDGGSSTKQNPTYTYIAAGTYDVVLTVTDSCAPTPITDTDTFSIVVSCPTLTATATGPATADVGTSESFTGAASGGIQPLSYAWDFGDGIGTSTEQNPTYTYTVAGAYTVTLDVTDSCSPAATTDTDTFPITVTCPAVTATASGPAATTVSTPESFTGSASGGILPLIYAWDFGDGIGTSALQNPSYTYTVAGNYTVTLDVTDSCSPAATTDTDTFPITVGP
jgi:PKD repeat protein